MTFIETGPYVTGAFFCEKILEEKDGVLTFVRVIDQYNIAVEAPEGADVPEDLPPTVQDFVYVVAMKSGKAKGRSSVRIDFEQPNGELKTILKRDVHFEGEDRGVNLIVRGRARIQEGLHWTHVWVENQEVTRTPLRVTYARNIRSGQSPPR